MSVDDRIEIAKKAIMFIRKKKGTKSWFNSKEYPLTYGCFGLLEYVKHGKPKMILDMTLQNTVEAIIADKMYILGDIIEEAEG